MSLLERMRTLQAQLFDLVADMPRETEGEIHARWNASQAEFWLQAAARAQERNEEGPLPRPHVAARRWRGSGPRVTVQPHEKGETER